ncbi:MAG: hypothetical protein NTX50_18335 [Candidatus Sumerlaeota bacterium]|nr:hypothetical protein [Candidatus Sumerlaeota bacterium]
MKARTLLLAAIILTVAQIAAHAAPGLITYQGRLANASGQPITSAVDVTFTFWTAESGGTQVGMFSDTDSVTPDSNGVYSTLIGDDPDNFVPEAVFATDAVWLNVAVGSENLTPRKRLVSAPYALRAGQAANAAALNGQPAAAFMAAGTDNWVNTTSDTMTGPLTIIGAHPETMLKASNTGTGYAGHFSASGDDAHGLYAYSSGLNGWAFEAFAEGTGASIGGRFDAAGGANSKGVEGNANNDTNVTNYGGYFTAAGASGKGAYGKATGVDGSGVHGEATGVNGSGVYGKATGTSGHAVHGESTGAEGYGGYFAASGSNGRGLNAYASADNGWALEAFAEGSGASIGGRFDTNGGNNGKAVEGYAANDGAFTNYGGYFRASGTTGYGVYSAATGASGTGGYFSAAGANGTGVNAYAAGTNAKAIEAFAEGSGASVGGYFETAGGAQAKAVSGLAGNSGNFQNIGGYFRADGALGTGVVGLANGANGNALYANHAPSNNGAQLGTNTYAAYFVGDVMVQDNFSTSPLRYGDVTVKGNYKYVDAKTCYKTIAPAAFNPYRPEDVGKTGLTYGYVYVVSGTEAILRAEVDIPNGATVTAFIVYYRNQSASSTMGLIASLNKGSLRSTGGLTNMATITESAISGPSVSITSSSDTTISNATIDQGNNFYYLYVNMTASGTTQQFCGVQLYYTVTTIAP